MAAPTRIYTVCRNSTGGTRLVRAAHPSQALQHVARGAYSVRVAEQDDIVDAMTGGAVVETAGNESAAATEAAIKAHPLDRIARVCHEVNRAYCQALGDDSQPAWEDAPAWQRESARMGVDLHLSGDFGPEASHAAWMSNKADEGWVYGPVKDPATKQHPCMVPFDRLPREQQAKDFIFRAIVHAMR